MRMRLPSAVLLGFCLLGSPPAAPAGTSNSLLDLTPDGHLLLAANPDNGTVTVIDTAERKVLREIVVGEQPEGVTWLGHGPLAAVTLFRGDGVVIFDALAGGVVAAIPVPADPYGVVAAADGRRLWVSHDSPGCVSEIDVNARKVTRTIPVGPSARGLALAADGRHLFVAEFLTARLHAVDLAAGRVTATWEGHDTDNLCRQVALHLSRPKAYLPHVRSRTHVVSARGSIFPQLSICDLRQPPADATGSPGLPQRTSFALDTFNGVYVTANPWEAAVSPDGRRLYVVYAATDDLNAATVGDEFRELERSGQPARVGRNPRAVRVSPDGGTVYVYNALDFAVGVHDAFSLRRLATVPCCAPPHTPEWVRGKVLFHSSDPPITRARWIACASCHPDGLSDGRVWQNPEGPRKTPHLFGLAHTHPLHWSADRDEVQDFEYTIRGKLMGGRGLCDGPVKPRAGFEPVELDETLAGRSADLDALAVYTNSFTFRLSPHIPAPGKLAPEAERGKDLFFRADVGCAACHSGPYYTDSRLQRPFNLHDVGTGDDPRERMGPKFDTPTLLGAYRSAPYLHHGRARTLLDVLTTANPHDRHGRTSHLTPPDRDALVAFLKSLPYEPPPDETPNSVPYRLRKR
jgi:YVTN family beta-propeller protein